MRRPRATLKAPRGALRRRPRRHCGAQLPLLLRFRTAPPEHASYSQRARQVTHTSVGLDQLACIVPHPRLPLCRMALVARHLLPVPLGIFRATGGRAPEPTLACWCRPAARASGMPRCSSQLLLPPRVRTVPTGCESRHCPDQLLLPLRFRAVPRFAGINCCCPRALGQCRLGTRVSIVRANCRCPGRAELLVAMLRRLAMPVQATALPGGTARHRRDVERPAAVGRVAYSIELERGRVKASCDAYPCHRIEPRAMSCAWRCGCVLRCPCRPPHCSQFLGRRPRVPSY